MEAEVGGGSHGWGASLQQTSKLTVVQKQVITGRKPAANAAAAQILIMPLLLLLLLSSSVESNTNNNNKEETEEAVTEYSSAFINVSWVEMDRQVKAGA